MKRFLAGLVFTLAVVWLAAGCGETNNTFQPNTGAFISHLSPSRSNAGGAAFTLTLVGAGFVSQTVVQWNGQNRPTTFVDSGQVTAAISAADIAAAGKVSVNTLNPSTKATDNGLSNTVTFFIEVASNPIPTISSLSTTSVTSGSAAFDLTITGTNFLPASATTTGSVVQWNAGAKQTNLTPKSITSTTIVVNIPANLVASKGSAIVTVFNPPPGGGTSAGGITFSVLVTSGPTGGRSAAPGGDAGAALAAQDTPAISGNGRFVAYAGAIPGSSGGITQIFLHDSCAEAQAGCVPGTMLVSAAADGSAGDAASLSPAISADGRYVAFSSAASNLSSGGTSGRQIYLRDTCIGAAGPDRVGAGPCVASTQLISTDAAGALAGAENILPAISASGRFVAFLSVTPSRAGDAAAGASAPNSGYRQVFVRDTCLEAVNCTPQTTRISLQPGDAPAGGAPARPALSGGAKRLALAGRDATLFTPGTIIDDSFFHALIHKTGH